MRKTLPVLLSVLVLSLVAGGCGGAPATPDSAEVEKAVQATLTAQAPEEKAKEQPAEEPAKKEEPESQTVARLEDVRNAVIQIEAQGSFVSPEDFNIYVEAGRGSGFIIAPEGIAVTNNHVVTGAALLRVWVGGDTDKTHNAKVLGVSQCSDLAVIDIEGDGFPYLTWHEGRIDVGLDVYAAGFPLGDPEFTLTRGIVAKARALGEWSWASVDESLEHDANIQPGNSGGPLVNQQGQVVGVNYAGYPGPAGTEQFFAIARAEALKIIDQLAAGKDVTSIGVNGEAFSDGQTSGVWVYSVQSGSPADKAGVRGGDIITAMEGLPLGTDGTVQDYCDILRSRESTDVMAIEVLRYATQEVLEGQLNGRELKTSFSFAQELEGEIQQEAGEPTGYAEYVAVYDDSEAIGMEIPAEWSDIDGSAWVVDDQEVGAHITAAPSLDGFYDTWTAPGVFFGASRSLAQRYNEAALLDTMSFTDSCGYDGRFDYEDPLYTGKYDVWTDCGGEGTTFIVLAAVPAQRQFVIVVQVQVVSDADLEALDTILNTFQVVGDL